MKNVLNQYLNPNVSLLSLNIAPLVQAQRIPNCNINDIYYGNFLLFKTTSVGPGGVA